VDTSGRVDNQYNRVSEKCRVREKECDPGRLFDSCATLKKRVCHDSSPYGNGTRLRLFVSREITRRFLGKFVTRDCND
jgi:hypothetical protein